MGCHGSKAATPAPAPGLLKEDKTQQEAKSKALKEQPTSPQTTIGGGIKDAIAALDADERRKLVEALSATSKPTGEAPTKTLAEYVAMSATATLVELEAALASVSIEDRAQLQEAITSFKSPPVEGAKLEEEKANNDAKQDDSQQLATEIGALGTPETKMETELEEEKPNNVSWQDDSQQKTTEVGTLNMSPVGEVKTKLEEEKKSNASRHDDSQQATAEADANELVEAEQKVTVCCWS
jgi:hypothetical protein